MRLHAASDHFEARNRLKCGVEHSDLAVVGRKSGCLEKTDDDICTASVWLAGFCASQRLFAQAFQQHGNCRSLQGIGGVTQADTARRGSAGQALAAQFTGQQTRGQ